MFEISSETPTYDSQRRQKKYVIGHFQLKNIFTIMQWNICKFELSPHDPIPSYYMYVHQTQQMNRLLEYWRVFKTDNTVAHKFWIWILKASLLTVL